jgi:membrane fusion protein (multidrug efflux system)
MPPPIDPNPKLHEVRPAEAPVANEPAPAPPRRKLVVLSLTAAVAALAAAGLGTHAWLTRGEVSTDDAQVEADVVALAPRVGGPVAEVLVSDDAQVQAGQPLFRIDDGDYQVKVRQAEADLATARAQVVAAQAQAGAAQAGLTRSQAEAERAQLDLKRAETLRQGDAIAGRDYDYSRIQSETAAAGTGATRAQYAAALAATELYRTKVQAAQAALDLARLQLTYTVVRAPAAGTVSRLGARVGQMVQPGQNVGQLVPDRSYLVANFKETQTGDLRPGQPVDVSLDAYPGRTFHGRVESLSGGTGARYERAAPVTGCENDILTAWSITRSSRSTSAAAFGGSPRARRAAPY